MSCLCHVSNFRYVRCQECHQRHPYPPSPYLDPWSTVGSFLTHFLDVGYGLELSCFKFHVSRMSRGTSKTPLSSIFRVASSEDRWFLTNFLDVGYFPEISCFKFQIFRMPRRPSKTPISSISRVGSLEDWWFLTNFLDVGYVLEMVLFKSQFCSSLCGVISLRKVYIAHVEV